MNQGKAGVAVAVGAVIVTFLAATLTIGMAMLSAVSGALPGGGCGGDGGLGGGSQSIGGSDWNAEQTENAATIVGIVMQRGLPKRAAVIAISTTIVESQLVNVGHGDRDSLGLFQQRPSQGWGSPAEVTNPVYATTIFLDRLVALPGWATMPPGAAAQAVQASAFPDRYAPQEAPAAALVEQFWSGPDNPVPAPDPAAPQAPNVQLASAAYACPDQGGVGVPLAPSDIDPNAVPPGFTPPTDPAQRAAVTFALAQLGKPYVWGGKGPDGFDCSGLMLAAWAQAGVAIPAGTVSQKSAGTPASPANIAPGDLVFIPGSLGSPGNPRHVGMYVGHGLVVNAYDSSTGVILQPLSDWADEITHVRHIAGPPGRPAPDAALAEAAP